MVYPWLVMIRRRSPSVTSFSRYSLRNAFAFARALFLMGIALLKGSERLRCLIVSCGCIHIGHAAKGLEFNTVFLIGMEEGIFPGNQTIMEGPAEIEEERRIAYVGITRALHNLDILYKQNKHSLY